MPMTPSPFRGADVFDAQEGQQTLRRSALLYIDPEIAALLVQFLDSLYYGALARHPHDWPECVSKVRLRAVLDDLCYGFSLVLSISQEAEESSLRGDDLTTSIAARTELVPALQQVIETFERVLGPPPIGQAQPRLSPGGWAAAFLEQVGRLLAQKGAEEERGTLS